MLKVNSKSLWWAAVATWTATALWCITNESGVHRKTERQREGTLLFASACRSVTNKSPSPSPDDIETTMKQLAPKLPHPTRHLPQENCNYQDLSTFMHSGISQLSVQSGIVISLKGGAFSQKPKSPERVTRATKVMTCVVPPHYISSSGCIFAELIRFRPYNCLSLAAPFRVNWRKE